MLESPYLFRLMRKRILARTNLGIPILIVSRKSKENVLILRSSSLVLEEHFLDILASYTMQMLVLLLAPQKEKSTCEFLRKCLILSGS